MVIYYFDGNTAVAEPVKSFRSFREETLLTVSEKFVYTVKFVFLKYSFRGLIVDMVDQLQFFNLP